MVRFLKGQNMNNVPANMLRTFRNGQYGPVDVQPNTLMTMANGRYQAPETGNIDWLNMGQNFLGQFAAPAQSTDPLTAAGAGAAKGAMGGAALGPYGALAGAAIGAAGSAINASDEASTKMVEDQDKQNELKMLYQKFLQGTRIADEDRARAGMDMFLNIGNQARKEYKGSARNAALRAAGVI
jgi:hypothetical protein